MNRITICLNTIDKIRDFINVAYSLNCKLKLSSGDHVVNGKSIIGIFTLDLSKAIDVTVVNDKPSSGLCPKELEPFMV